MKKALLLLLTLLLVCPPALSLQAEAADFPDAYRKVVQDVVDEYGVFNYWVNSEEGEDLYEKLNATTGYLGRLLADLTGDGQDELCLFYAAPSDGTVTTPAAMYCSIYTLSGGAAREIYTESCTSATYFSIYEYGGGAYLGGGQFIGPRTFYVWRDGRFVKPDMTKLTPDQSRRLDEAQQKSYSDWLEMRDQFLLEQLGVPQVAATKTLYLVDGDFIFPGIHSERTQELLDMNIRVPGYLFLANYAYIGDPSKCKMDEQMVLAYAEVIDSLPVSEDNRDLYVTLADFADDGWPILLTMYLDSIKTTADEPFSSLNNYFGTTFSPPTFWGYKNGAAYQTEIGWASYGKLGGKGLVYSNSWDMNYSRSRYYTVSRGQIELVHDIESYSAYKDGGKLRGSVPDGATYVNSDYTLDESKLAENGWMQREDGSWHLSFDNGENVTRKILDGGIASILGSTLNEKERISYSGEGLAMPVVYIDAFPAADVSAALRAYAGSASGYSQPTPDGISITVKGVAVTWTDAAPFIDANDRTMVPLRAVADAMGLDVNWDAAAREASFTGSGKTIYFPIGSTNARTSSGGTVKMDTAAVIVNDRTYAPIRYLAEYFGYTVGWDAATRTVTITG